MRKSKAKSFLLRNEVYDINKLPDFGICSRDNSEIGLTLSISHLPRAVSYAHKIALYPVKNRAPGPFLRCPFPISHFYHISVTGYLVPGSKYLGTSTCLSFYLVNVYEMIVYRVFGKK
jgi:hypothetical protein